MLSACFPFQLFDLTNFHEIWDEHYAIGSHLKPYFFLNFLNDMVGAQNCEVPKMTHGNRSSEN